MANSATEIRRDSQKLREFLATLTELDEPGIAAHLDLDAWGDSSKALEYQLRTLAPTSDIHIYRTRIRVDHGTPLTTFMPIPDSLLKFLENWQSRVSNRCEQRLAKPK